MNKVTDNGYSVVVGLGKTGLSCARFLAAQGIRFVMADSRSNAPGDEEMRQLFPAVELHLGSFDSDLFKNARQLVLSPGVAPQDPAIVAAAKSGVEVIGDIELFARYVNAPVVAITGSNGKSTVTTLVGEMAKKAGINVRVGGNLGTPALDLLQQGTAPDLYVLELSSFQLEVTNSLNASAATVLNISEDHLDRHGTVEAYSGIKQRIFNGNGVMVLNRDDPVVAAMAESKRSVIYFSLNESCGNDYGLQQQNGDTWIARGTQRLIATKEIRIAGRHNWANAMASLALGEAVGLPMPAMTDVLRSFPGLPHRCQWIAEQDGVTWYEDSKGTNVGATLAALNGMPGKKVVLIAGGQGKGQDFTPLREPAVERARAVVLIGEDAPLIAQALGESVPLIPADSMEEAVARAAEAAEPGDCVLLSPACASFDMFANYIARGEAFVSAVHSRGAR